MLVTCLIILYSSAFILFGCERLYPAHKNTNSGSERVNWYLRASFINSFNLAVFYLVDEVLCGLRSIGWISQSSLFEFFGLAFDLREGLVDRQALAQSCHFGRHYRAGRSFRVRT